MILQETIAIAFGGALGALSRYWMGYLVTAYMGPNYPYGTLAINILGSLLMGVFYVLMVEKTHLSALWRSVAIVGFLGAFTTFSTFSLQAFALFEESRFIAALGYVLISVTVCILASAAGVVAARQFYP
jgi:CrcB protein